MRNQLARKWDILPEIIKSLNVQGLKVAWNIKPHTAVCRMHSDEEVYPNSQSVLIHLV